jgi:peptidoglycan/LPS O-acetylase OafA/YrhL
MRKYYPSLDIIRAIATLIILVAHIELAKKKMGQANFFEYFLQPDIGQITMTAFFVLSSFLITDILLSHGKKFKGVEFKTFIKSRALRILPAYYFLLVLAYAICIPLTTELNGQYDFFQFNQNDAFNILPRYLILFPQFNFYAVKIPFIHHLWSVGVECVFYILWPLLYYLSPKNFGKLLLYTGTAFLAIKVLVYLETGGVQSQGILKKINRLFFVNRLECMFLGSLGAFALHNKLNGFLKHFMNSKFILALCILSLFAFLFLFKINVLMEHFLIATSLTVIIYHVAMININTSKILMQPVFKLGKLSYQTYIIHPVIIIFLVLILEPLFSKYGMFTHVLLYISAISLSIFSAHLIKIGIENPLLVYFKGKANGNNSK